MIFSQRTRKYMGGICGCQTAGTPSTDTTCVDREETNKVHVPWV